MTSNPRVRIAPSPTGDPHVGTAYVALFNWAFARAQGGTFILRIDDTDRTRYRPESEEAILRSLSWLGFDWNEGPDVGGESGPYRQSERRELYLRRTDELLEKGTAYRCFCTSERLAEMREEQRAKKLPGGYDRRCRDLPREEVEKQLAAGTPHVVRLAMPRDGATSFEDGLRGMITVENREVDDQVLLKSDGFPTYHLCSVVDDIAFGITHVVRAEEWIVSTPKHVQIYQGFGEPLPKFFHVPLLRNSDGSKISKRKNPVSLDFFREQGYLPEALLNFLSNMGWSHPEEEEIYSLDYFRDHFRLEDLNVGGPVFDLVKLQWMNGMYIRQLTAPELAKRLKEGGFLPLEADPEGVTRILPLVIERLHLLSDFEEKTKFFFAGADPLDAKLLVPKKKTASDGSRMLKAVQERLASLEEWSTPKIADALEEVRETLEFTKPQIFMPLRVALTGRKESPSVDAMIQVLGQDEVVSRLGAAVVALET